MDSIKVVHFQNSGMKHNWEVYRGEYLLGYVHCDGDGNDFGGSLHLDKFDDETWDKVQELCHSDLADYYLIDRMETIGY